jgi:hypothetical protein
LPRHQQTDCLSSAGQAMVWNDSATKSQGAQAKFLYFSFCIFQN